MVAEVEPMLLTATEAMDQSLALFIGSAHHMGYIGLKNAQRLLDRTSYDDPDPQMQSVREILRATGKRNLKIAQEVIPPALRTDIDFGIGNPVMYRIGYEASHWQDGVVDDVTESGIQIVSGGHANIELPSYYPGLFTVEDSEILKNAPRKRHVPSLSNYVIKLSFFDPRTSATFLERRVINNIARYFKVKPEPLDRLR